MRDGSLTVVGSGIQTLGQMTEEAGRAIEQADRVLHTLSDPLAEEWISRLNPVTESLLRYYQEGENRWSAYRGMVNRICERVMAGERICTVFYGHPGVFVYPTHEAIRRLREEGFPAVMLPGISAEDCLLADLQIDPLQYGCQAYEATDFLLHLRCPDPASFLILWQVDAVGDNSYRQRGNEGSHVSLLLERLVQFYTPVHSVILYDAAVFPLCPPAIRSFPLSELPKAVRHARGVGTLLIPPAATSSPDKSWREVLV